LTTRSTDHPPPAASTNQPPPATATCPVDNPVVGAAARHVDAGEGKEEGGEMNAASTWPSHDEGRAWATGEGGHGMALVHTR